jgi:hypothetical protein
MSETERAGFPTAEQIRKVGLGVENLNAVVNNFKRFKAYLRKIGFTTKQVKRITPYVFDPKSAVNKLQNGQILIAVIIRFDNPKIWPFVDIPAQNERAEQLKKYGQVLSAWSCAEIQATKEVFYTYLMVADRPELLKISNELKDVHALVLLYPNPKLNMDRYETILKILPEKHADWKLVGVL